MNSCYKLPIPSSSLVGGPIFLIIFLRRPLCISLPRPPVWGYPNQHLLYIVVYILNNEIENGLSPMLHYLSLQNKFDVEGNLMFGVSVSVLVSRGASRCATRRVARSCAFETTSSHRFVPVLYVCTFCSGHVSWSRNVCRHTCVLS